jgi:hypothetical protein
MQGKALGQSTLAVRSAGVITSRRCDETIDFTRRVSRKICDAMRQRDSTRIAIFLSVSTALNSTRIIFTSASLNKKRT